MRQGLLGIALALQQVLAQFAQKIMSFSPRTHARRLGQLMTHWPVPPYQAVSVPWRFQRGIVSITLPSPAICTH